MSVAFKFGIYTLLLQPLTYISKCIFLVRNRRPTRHLFCTEFFLLDLITLGEMVLHVLFWRPPIVEIVKTLTFTVTSANLNFEFWSNSQFVQPYIAGVYMLSFLLKFFFSLKVTRLFGPFTKLIKLSARSLLTWLVFSSLLLFVGGFYFSTLLSQS